MTLEARKNRVSFFCTFAAQKLMIMAAKRNNEKQTGGFIKLPRNLESIPGVAKILDRKGGPGLGTYIHINLYLAHCEGGWGTYSGRQFSALAAELKKNRKDVRDIIDNYGLFIIDGDRFTSLWMQQQFANAGEKTRSSRTNLLIRAEDIDKDINKKNIEKATVRVSDDTHMASGEENQSPPSPSMEEENSNCNYQNFSHYLKR